MENMNTREGEEEGRVITLSEAGEILHVSYATRLRLVAYGELKAFRIRNSWRTRERRTSIVAYIAGFLSLVVCACCRASGAASRAEERER